MNNNEEFGTGLVTSSESATSATTVSNKRAFITKYWTLAVIAILMSAVIALSSVLIVVLKNKDNGEHLFDDSYKQQRQEAYSQTKTLLQEALISNSLPNVVAPKLDNSQEQEILKKYNINFFDDCMKLLDDNTEPELIANFIFNQFDDYEWSLFEQVSKTIDPNVDIVVDDIVLNNEFSRLFGRFRLSIVFEFSKSMIAGFLAGYLVSIIPAVIALSAAVAPLIGVLIGVAIGSMVYYLVERLVSSFLKAVGASNVTYKWFEQELVNIWWFSNVNIRLNITSILFSILGVG